MSLKTICKNKYFVYGFYTIVLFLLFGVSNTFGQGSNKNKAKKAYFSVEGYLVEIAKSPVSPAWELQHYDSTIQFQAHQLIEYFRKVEAALLQKGIEHDQPLDSIQTEGNTRYPLQGKLYDTLVLMNLNPSPKLLPELKRIIESPRLPDFIRGKAVLVYGRLGGNQDYLQKLLNHDKDGIRAAALAAIGLRTFSSSDVEQLRKIFDFMREKKHETTSNYLGRETDSMIGEIGLILTYYDLPKKSQKYKEYPTYLTFLFDRVYPGDGGISENPSVQVAARILHVLLMQNEQQAIEIIRDHVRQKEGHYKSIAQMTMWLLNLPLEKQDQLELEKSLGFPLEQHHFLNVPGVPIYQRKTMSDTK